jgi:GT2 family glycosyltransferase
MNRVTIVIPVYADWISLRECISSLKKFISPEHKVLIVNDCGPEAEKLEVNIKKAIKASRSFKYYRNAENLGFVQTCNRAALELDKTNNDILMLNSDTKVTKNFLEELVSVLHSQSKIGTVSPRTNNATICTFPLSAISQKGIDPSSSYELFMKFKDKLPAYNEAPTAHGFCMLIKRTVIKKHGLFDPIFGKGYGEEVDFCQRIHKHGWLNVICNRSYVFHLEARSFSPEAKIKMIEQSSQIINTRYPHYKQSVTTFIKTTLEQEQSIIGKEAATELPAHSSNILKWLLRKVN